jgi:hypothetical protein
MTTKLATFWLTASILLLLAFGVFGAWLQEGIVF